MKGEFQEAMPYFDQALEIFQAKNDLNSIAVVNSQIGHYLIKGGEEESGLDYLQRSVKINRETGNRQPDQAFEHLLLCEEIFKETGDLNMLSQTYDGFSQYYEKKGNYQKALNYHRQFNSLRDSVYRIEDDERIANAELRYNAEKSKTENARLTRDNILKEPKTQTKPEYYADHCFV